MRLVLLATYVIFSLSTAIETETNSDYDNEPQEPYVNHILNHREEMQTRRAKLMFDNPRCMTAERTSPINIDLAATQEVYTPALKFYNYAGNENVVENYENPYKEVTEGYSYWKNPPYVEGGPLKGRFYLMEVQTAFRNFYSPAVSPYLNMHMINGAGHMNEIHLVHTLDGIPLAEARNIPDSVLIINVFINLLPSDNNATTAFSKYRYNETTEMIRWNAKETNETASYTWIQPNDFLPFDRSTFFFYNGTFAHLPCNEPATWIIFAEPIFMHSMNETLFKRYKHAVLTESIFLHYGIQGDSHTEAVTTTFAQPRKAGAFLRRSSKKPATNSSFLEDHFASSVSECAAIIIAMVLFIYYQRKELNKKKTVDGAEGGLL